MSGPNADAAIGQQDYRTPVRVLEAIQNRLDIPYFSWDLACEAHNCLGQEGGYIWPELDALKQDWSLIVDLGWAWCNPPFAQSGAFCRMAAQTPGLRAVFLVPVAIGTRWWKRYVHLHAHVLGVGRMVFNNPDGTPVQIEVKKNGVGTGVWKDSAINRDVAILVYGNKKPGVYSLEDWRNWEK